MPKLTDNFNRNIHYLRLSVTDRCDLRCSYCLPEDYRDFALPDNWLSANELQRLVTAFVQLGVTRVRLTGGEPLVRRDLPEIAQALRAIPGLDDLSLSTNASRLANHAEALHDCGITRINVSLDSLNEALFKKITKGKLSKVIDGLMAAKTANFGPIKINMVVMAENRHEVPAMIEFCRQHGFTLRLIETMPMGDTGCTDTRSYVSLQDIRAELAQHYELIPSVMPGGGPARYEQIAGTDFRIGYITPRSQHFCDTCNRVRLSPEGTLYLCLGQDDKVELGPLVRSGATEQQLQQAIIDAIALKPEKHEFNEQPGQIVRFMSLTGG